MDQMLKLITEMLNSACGNLSDQPLREGGKSEIDEFNGGFQEYTIDTHCVRFIISAKVDRTKDLEDPARWEIRNWVTTNC